MSSVEDPSIPGAVGVIEGKDMQNVFDYVFNAPKREAASQMGGRNQLGSELFCPFCPFGIELGVRF